MGYARRDGTNAGKAVFQYLQTKQFDEISMEAVAEKVRSIHKSVVTKDDIKRLEAVEDEEAQKRGVEEYKFSSNEEMLQAMGLIETA